MAPKKEKKEPELGWRTQIVNAVLDEETWKVKVVMFEAAGSDQDRIYLNKFEVFATEEKRFVIKNICKTETIFMVNQLGCEKKVKDDNLRVFEEGQAFLKEKLDIPADILALIIKHLILKMKEEYLFIRRQKLEVKEGMRRESTTMIDKSEVRGSVNVKPPEIIEPPSTPKGKSKKGSGEPDSAIPEPVEGKKYNTNLRLRGEEWRDKVYVDDYPTDGPNLYVAITGFVDPLLPSNLMKIGIPLSAIVQIRIDPNTTKVPSALLRPTKRGQSKTDMLAEISLTFWEDLQSLRINKTDADDYKNTAFVIFSPPYWDSESLSGSAEKIYDEICFLMYDVQDLTRQHRHYLNNMDVLNISSDVIDERYAKHYQQQLEDIPLECVTCYSVIDSILHTVCGSQEIKESSSRSSLSSVVTMTHPAKHYAEDGKGERAENFVKEVFNTLCKTEANRKVYRLTYGEEYENLKPPIVINYGDFVKYPTFQLGNMNLENIVMSSLHRMPLNKLWDMQFKPHGELEAKINFHVNILLSCFEREDVETAELNRLIHVLACRKLYNNRSSLKKKHLECRTISDFKKIFLKRSILAEPLARNSSLHSNLSSRTPSFPAMMKTENNVTDDCYGKHDETSRIKFLFDCPDISELVSAAELTNGAPINHMIDDFEYFEDFSGPSAFQIMIDAFNKFNCVDYKYCEVTDCFVLMFFNSHDNDGISRYDWRFHLPTPLCLQDFFDFVLEENYDWIQTEEKIYDEAMQMKTQSEYKVIIDPNAIKSCVGDTEVATDLLMEGSLKYLEFREVEDPNEISNPEISHLSSSTTTDLDSKISKKTKPTSTPKNRHRQSFMTSRAASDFNEEIPPKEFLGYNLGDRRVEVFGKDATYFSRDGTRVNSSYTLIIPTNVEYIVMSVVLGNNCNEFWLQRALGDNVSPEVANSCQSFRIVSKDQVMMNIKKQTYKVQIPVSAPLSTDFKAEDLFETNTYHSLFVTWPNGLITESIYEKNSPVLSHIKQYHTVNVLGLDEIARCISLNGEVLIYKKSGIIEVLKPDGSVIKISKYYEQLVVPEVNEEILSDHSSEKSKKSKGKLKGKESKTSHKEHEKEQKEMKPPEYELVIEDFECIETTGLRQRWTHDVPSFIENILVRTATDFCLGEVFSRRMDGTHILLNKDGVQIVTFPNKTRIISKFIIEDEEIYPEWTKDEMYLFEMKSSGNNDSDSNKSRPSMSQKSYVGSQASVSSSVSGKKVAIKEMEVEEEHTQAEVVKRIDGYVSVQIIFTIEHTNFTTVSINKSNNEITVESPNNTTVVIDSKNNYDITLDSATKASFNGENLHISYEACPACRSYTTCDVKITPDELSSVTKLHQNWLKMKDSYTKRIVVNEEGSIILVEEPFSDENMHSEEAETVVSEETADNGDEHQADRKSENSVISHGKCREMYLAKTIRFLILRRELSCSELVHRSLLEQYNHDCRWQPWCSISQHDTFGDRRSLLSVLTPVHFTETEKWLMDSKLASKPKYLTYKDLKKDCGKGFYHWMRPYKRFEPRMLKPENALPPRLPRAFVLRTLEQQWKESDRDTYKGAKELLRAILKYRHIVEADCETLLHVPLIDMRPEDERRIDDVIQAIAHRIYEDLRIRLADDVQSRAKADITTKPPPVPEEISVEGEHEEEMVDPLKQLEEERSSQLKQMEDEDAMSPQLRRYWRRRTEEFMEEQFYTYLLREGSVPPYFRNVLGGAIWWEMNDTADQAVTKAERRREKCTCSPTEDQETSESDIPSSFL